MNLRLHPLYKNLLLLAIVLGPIAWLMLTEDGRRRTDLVMLHLFGKGELDLAIEQLHSGMREASFRELFPDLTLACEEKESPFGDRLCTADIGAFNQIPARAFSLFLSTDRLRAAKLDYRRAYYEDLKNQLKTRLGRPTWETSDDSATTHGPLVWKTRDGLLLLPAEEPELDSDASLIWLSVPAARRWMPGEKGGPT
jgi:hypothetical protein